MSKLLKGGGIAACAVLLSTIGIFASDSLQGIDRDLVGMVNMSSDEVCPRGMVLAERGERSFCIDRFEASAATACPHASPRNIIESEENANSQTCLAASVEGQMPWRFISLTQAQRMCAGAGKRLPTAAEWYFASLGTDVSTCNTNTGAPRNAQQEMCRASTGTYDMVGNVWEWVDATVNGRTFNERELPEEGYIGAVDPDGVALETGDTADDLYGADYFWSDEGGVHGMIRGGFYGSDDDAGLYTVNAAVETSFASAGVGFRCVKDV